LSTPRPIVRPKAKTNFKTRIEREKCGCVVFEATFNTRRDETRRDERVNSVPRDESHCGSKKSKKEYLSRDFQISVEFFVRLKIYFS